MKIDHGKFSEEQRNLVQGSTAAKRAFLKKFFDSDSKSFRKVFKNWGLEEGPQFTLPKEAWEDDVFKSHPYPEDLSEIVDMFAKVQACDLSRPATWYAIHIRLVEEGIINKLALAYGGRGAKTGYNSLQTALASEEAADTCVRNILRHAGGILQVRGNRSAFLDCPTGAFYWKCRFSLDTVGIYKMNPRSVYDALEQSGVWETLVEGIVSCMTIVGDSKTRPALIAYIAEELEKDPGKQGVKAWAREIRNKVGQMSLIRHFGFLEPQELLATLKLELRN